MREASNSRIWIPPLVVLLFLAISPLASAAEDHWILQAAEWSRPRSGAAVLDMEPVAAAVRALHASPNALLVLVHASGEEGALWAAELRDWLVALGVSPEQIEILAGGPSGGELELQIQAR